MTKLSARKRRLRFKTDRVAGWPHLLVECHPRYLMIRPPWSRRDYTVTWESILWLGAKQDAVDRVIERMSA